MTEHQVVVGSPRRGWQRWLRRPHPATLVVLVATAAAMVWTYLSTHQIYPDTQYYLAWTYRLLGYDADTAERVVLDYIDRHATFEPYAYLWGSPTAVPSTRPRVLLPLLSAPLVAAFGPGAIVVVPGIAFAAAIYVCYRFAARHATAPAAAAAVCLALLSPLVVTWSVGGLTDSLALLLHALLFLIMPWQRSATWRTVGAAAALTAATAAARTIVPFTAAAVAGLWLWAMWAQRGRRWSWTAVSAGAAVGVIIGLVYTRIATRPLTTATLLHAMTGGRAHSYREALPWFREQVPIRGVDELRQIAGSWPLLLLVVLSLVACVTAWRTVVPWLVIPAWLGAVGVFLMNPAVTAFRYELPVLPASVVAVAVLVGQMSRLAKRHAFLSLPGTSRSVRTPVRAATGVSPTSSNDAAQ